MSVLILGQVHSFNVQGEFKSDPRMVIRTPVIDNTIVSVSITEDEELMMKCCVFKHNLVLNYGGVLEIIQH